jgi:UDP-N-acetylglucosamine 2-epimerase (non-hydrolysing)
MKKKIMLVFGTRPEAIKMAPLFTALKNNSLEFDIIVCVTAQHRQMLDQVLSSFNIPVDIDLDLMTEGQDLFDITAGALLKMRDILKNYCPDVVMVHGDTTTTLAASTACFYLNIPVWHVEAGLRTYNIKAPFPEEFNRQVVSKVADMHLAPTNFAKKNLISEGVQESQILVTGNTVIDALLLALDCIENDKIKKDKIIDVLNSHLPFDWIKNRFILITGHRRENFGNGFREICKAIKELADKYQNVHFVYPLHLNPSVQQPANEFLGESKNIHLIPPLEYEYFIMLLNNCHLVMTDSGGIQEEAPSLGKPVLVLRDVTERPEAVEAKTVILVGANRKAIIGFASKLLEDEKLYSEMSLAHNPYGDGKASARIVSKLKEI